jgi:hypothetical protein
MKIEITKQHSTADEGFRSQYFPWLRQSIRVIVILLVAMSLTLSAARFASAQEPRPTIRVRVDNYTFASPAILAGAEHEASRILDAAGLRSIWLDCQEGHSTSFSQDPCRGLLETTDIVVRVDSEPTQNKFQDSVFGFAILPALATVYYAPPARLAKSDNAEFELPLILGCVMAHEIGHLLLGLNGHSDSGIMQPRWERKQIHQAMIGTLIFTRRQAKHIREETQSRRMLETAHLNSPN